MARFNAESMKAFSQSGVRHTAADQQAAIDSVFGQIARLAPPMLQLQQALLSGLAQAQRREAKRLAGTGGDEAGAERALERARRARDLQQEVASFARLAGQLAEGLTEKPLFHGYVLDAEGEPAPDHIVRIVGDSAADQNYAHVGRREAKTDATGYFRFEFDTVNEYRMMRVTERETYSAVGAAPAQDAARFDVEVLDPEGTVVFHDPAPPSFSGRGAEFRFYPLLDLRAAAHRFR
ncbi:hypothetical protein NSE01_05740 [Novosphingobium sediminis]|uniref:Uncharacterized protein n=1 Tax=Novosphingobium sediminis TaxID=707214 RepID=A0A512AGB5_9SPHN|nr:carboxypeptidase-like regulatory domain-containing protein [Novosphingobium sediminis]GEN98741.1 hypothetical protein NSE01_05740 [Novosphingobium sediminis]